jgi:hypothetical protein
LVIGDDGSITWNEIVGEQSRGGYTIGLTPDQSFEILGELVQRSPAMAQYAAQRVAAYKPIMQKAPLNKARDWQMDFGPVSGGAGTTTTITQTAQCYFRAEKVMATDTASPAGSGTRIQTIVVGNKLQRPLGGGGTLTSFFANNALGNGVKWDTCQPGLTISIGVSFISQCTLDLTVFGKAVS